MIQAVITPEHRGGLGMHYTSVPNIMKVIEPLFLTELLEEFEANLRLQILQRRSIATTTPQNKFLLLASIRYFSFTNATAMLKIILFLLTGSFISVTLLAQTKKPITHEAMWMMKRVGAPEVSPDGSMVIFSLQEPSYIEKDVTTDLWIVSANGSGKPRRLTFSKSAETGYKWSPDSRSIAFSAKREAQSEIPPPTARPFPP